VAEPLLRNGPVDRRRLDAQDRQSYSPAERGKAVQLVKAYQANKAYQSNRPRNTTEQKPGSGGFQTGSITQAIRQSDKSYDERRSESFRPEVDPDNQENQAQNEQQDESPRPPVNADSLKKELTGGKYF
jgi:hypothetical protein